MLLLCKFDLFFKITKKFNVPFFKEASWSDHLYILISLDGPKGGPIRQVSLYNKVCFLLLGRFNLCLFGVIICYDTSYQNIFWSWKFEYSANLRYALQYLKFFVYKETQNSWLNDIFRRSNFIWFFKA